MSQKRRTRPGNTESIINKSLKNATDEVPSGSVNVRAPQAHNECSLVRRRHKRIHAQDAPANSKSAAWHTDSMIRQSACIDQSFCQLFREMQLGLSWTRSEGSPIWACSSSREHLCRFLRSKSAPPDPRTRGGITKALLGGEMRAVHCAERHAHAAREGDKDCLPRRRS